MFNNPPPRENRAVWEVVWKILQSRAGHRRQYKKRRMRPKATNTHS